MDGVLMRISLSTLKTSEVIGNYDPIRLYRDTEGYPLLNPMLLSLPSDELFVITNCSSEKSADQKRRWLRHFYGDRLTLLPIFMATDKWGKDYVDPVARAKLDIIYKHKIEAYFDDDPAIIRRMRDMHYDKIYEALRQDLPTQDIAFFKWGPWIEEWY